MRYLAIDWGTRRIGLAMGDDVLKLPMPVTVIEATADVERWRLLDACVAAQDADALVLGLPLNMDGSEGNAATLMRKLAAQLERRYRKPVHLLDERLSSHAAEAQLQGRELTHREKKQRRDALAACVILQDFFRQRDG